MPDPIILEWNTIALPTHLVWQERELVLEPDLGEVGAVELVVNPRAVGLLLEEQCQCVKPDLHSGRGYPHPAWISGHQDTHQVTMAPHPAGH